MNDLKTNTSAIVPMTPTNWEVITKEEALLLDMKEDYRADAEYLRLMIRGASREQPSARSSQIVGRTDSNTQELNSTQPQGNKGE